jgi:hypothetical protein
MRLLIELPETADAADEILQSLKRIVEGTPASDPSQRAHTIWRIQFRLAENAMAMGTNPLLLDELRGLGTATVTAMSGQSSLRYGDIAIERLILKMSRLGCGTGDLRAKVFGGAAVLPFGVAEMLSAQRM